MRSINTRITIYSLAIFVLSIWAMALFAIRMLQNDLQQHLGEQQFSTAAIVAQEVEQEVSDRLHGLARVAESIPRSALNNPKALNALLESNPLFMEMFNAGAFITDLHGTAIASVPVSAKRIGLNYMHRDHIQAAIQEGRASVSEPVIGLALQKPVVSIAVPIRDTKGAVVGSLSGVTNLKQGNFLDRVLGHRYGASGGFVLIDTKHRRIITATDRSNLLESPAPEGVRPLLDRYIQGFEGFGLETDAQGVENLTAAHKVKAADWVVQVLLPTHEAFAPIHSMQQRMLYFTAVLTVLVGALTWWLLRRELAPLRSTARKLAALRQDSALPEQFTVQRNDEIGQVLGGFNQLLTLLRARENALQKSEERFRTLVDWTPEAIAVHAQGKILFVNPSAVRLLGASDPRDLLGHSILDFVHPDFHAVVIARSKAVLDQGTSLPPIEEKFLQLDGTPIDVEVQAISIQFNGQTASQVAMYDITERKANERRLRQLSRITEQSPTSIVITNTLGNIEYVNPRFEQVTGYLESEVLGKNPRILQSGSTQAATYADLWTTLTAGKVWRGEFYNRKKNGEDIIEEAVIAPVLNAEGVTTHYVALKDDITLRKQNELQLAQLLLKQESMLQQSAQSEAALQTAVRDKTALLNEVHHRVKNNLQVITSLLRLEEGRSANPDTRSVLREMQGRIRAMGLVHETLYRSGTFAEVDLHTYIQQVTSNTFRAQIGGQGNVRLVLELLPIRAGIDQATPCGLLVNELVSNAIKHGFPQGRAGEIKVSLRATTDPQHQTTLCSLQVSDTGCGLPPDFEERRKQSLGMQLVFDLAKQLGATPVIESSAGARIALTFRLAVAEVAPPS
jgi:PAS domain S-box-containing protein